MESTAMRHCRPALALIVVAFAAIALTARASGGVRRHDVADSLHLSLANSFGSVVYIQTTSGTAGSGVLISPEWVLTAAHVIDDGSTSATITVGANALTDLINGRTFTATQLTPHPSWTSSLEDGFDIGLLRITSQSSSAPPLPAPAARYWGSAELGKTGVLVGFGVSGTGTSGSGFLPDYRRRAGENRIDLLASQDPLLLEAPNIFGGNAAAASTFLVSDFDDPPAQSQQADANNAYWSALDPLALEFMAAPGDSGGGLFAEFDSGWQLVGITSWIHGYFDGTDNASYSDVFAATRVSDFNDWIDQTAGIPEPSALLAVPLVAALALARRPSCPRRPV